NNDVRPSIDRGGETAGFAVGGGAATPTPIATRAGGLLAVDFDLSDPFEEKSGSGSAIGVSKKVKFNGKDAGSAELRIGSGSTVAIARGELSRLLSLAGR